MDLEKVSRDDWIVTGVALLLAIDLLFFPWFSFSASVGSITVSASASATSAPDGWLGVLALLAVIALIADLLVERLADVQVPEFGGSRAATRFFLAAAAAVFMALKFLFHIHFSYFSWGFYLGVVLIIALVVLTSRARAAGLAGTAA